MGTLPFVAYATTTIVGAIIILFFHGAGSNAVTRLFGLTVVANTGWAFLYMLQVLVVSPILGARLLEGVFFFGMLAAGTFFLFALQFTGYHSRLPRPRLLKTGVWVYLLASAVLSVVNHRTHLVYDGYESIMVGDIMFVEPHLTPVAYGFAVIGWGLTMVAATVMIWFAFNSDDFYRGQSITIMLSVFLPVVGSLVDVFDLLIAGVGVTPICYLLGILFIGAAVFRYQFSDSVPLDREDILNAINVGVLVIDADNHIVHVNEDVQRELKRLTGSVPSPGDSLESVMPDSIRDINWDTIDQSGETIHLSHAGHDKWYLVSRVEYETETGNGAIFSFIDVTEREQHRRQLRHQNNRLDEFAGVLSHDLRNPLNVAMAGIALTEDELDEGNEQLTTATDALERMEDIIDDALAMARIGGHVDADSVEKLELDAVATDTWETVETAAATLQIDESMVFHADRQKLSRVFENLYRNAVEHGGSNVTVRVGALDNRNGFYIEDDGPGIPDDIKENVFEKGFTTTDDGTGFGVAIVREIVRAHGWGIEIQDSADGGARFVITGVPAP